MKFYPKCWGRIVIDKSCVLFQNRGGVNGYLFVTDEKYKTVARYCLDMPMFFSRGVWLVYNDTFTLVTMRKYRAKRIKKG